ncbi:hypothetical protein ES703_77489 [subsurface metagenome]
MVERQLFEIDFQVLLLGKKIREHNGIRKLADVRICISIGHDNNFLNRSQVLDYFGNPLERIEGPVLVIITIGSEQYLRFDLPEPIEHALYSEIWRAGRPDCPDARSGQH